jgi:hypothetical protein
MFSNEETLEQLRIELNSLRAQRNLLLTQKQIVSVLDSELTTLELQLSNLSQLGWHPDFYQEQEKFQTAMEKTAHVWFG